MLSVKFPPPLGKNGIEMDVSGGMSGKIHKVKVSDGAGKADSGNGRRYAGKWRERTGK